jgi:hypothetical protein
LAFPVKVIGEVQNLISSAMLYLAEETTHLKQMCRDASEPLTHLMATMVIVQEGETGGRSSPDETGDRPDAPIFPKPVNRRRPKWGRSRAPKIPPRFQDSLRNNGVRN